MEKERALLIKKLGLYFEIKRKTLREIIVVFDGGRASHPEREVKKRVIIYFSGIRDTADDVIIEQSKKRLGDDILLITYDRALIEHVQAFHKKVVVMQPDLFWHLMQKSIIEQKGLRVGLVGHDIKKFDQDIDDFLPQGAADFDVLMESSILAGQLPIKDESEEPQGKVIKSKQSKEEKVIEKVMKKL